MVRNVFLILLVLCSTFADAQKKKVKLKKDDALVVENLLKHVRFLADDKLEGRRTGTAGEKEAANYISSQFQLLGLQPKGATGYLQPFGIDEGKQIGSATLLTIDGKGLQPGKEFFPLVYSPNVSLEAMPSVALQEQGMPWFLDIKDLLEANAANPHFDLNETIRTKAKEAKKKGATALFIYNTSKTEDGLSFDGKDRSEVLPIPVVYLTRDAVKKYLADESAMLDLRLKTEITDRKRTGSNVVGYIDNGAANTVVLGAHFDHLGYGEDHNSRYTGADRQVHNGADDNASGTAALLELARLLKASKYKGNNYLFIAFSGEEQGLYGSKYFTEHPTVDLNTINYMINMDMVGRLNDSSHTITVGGYGTSPAWGEVYGRTGKKALYAGDLQFRFDSSGTGPSDHTSFYLKGIPVLFYFTGLHSDYHKPTDDVDKINFVGEYFVVKHILSLIEAEDKQGAKLPFSKTREPQTTTSARFSVTMGIMPDYTFNGAGVRVDGISEGRPAQAAGLKAGDVITALDDFKITSMESYMQALGKYKKGDKAKVSYSRGAQALSTTVEF